MSKRLVLLLLFTALLQPLSSQDNDPVKVVTPHVSPTLRFTENAGQWENTILFRAQLDGGALFLEKNGLTFNFYDKLKFRELHNGAILKGKYKDHLIKGHAYRIRFEGANPNPSTEKYQQGEDYENFFIGNDKSKWKSAVKNFHQIFLRNIYNNIHYEALTTTQGIKYNFYVKPNGNPNDIKLKYEGAEKLRLRDNVLYIKLSVNDVIEQKPYAYQIIKGKVKTVACNYKLSGDVLSFDFPKGYDKNYELVIDPTLVFSAQTGSTADNFGMTATYDAAGNFYTAGTCFFQGYPTVVGSYNVNFTMQPGQTGPLAGITDVVITKFNSNGSALLYSTYIGGSETEVVSSLVVDNSDNLCFYGATGSANFPMTNGCYDNTFNNGFFLSFYFNGTTFNNGTDIYVAKFNSTGTTLLGSTFLGGSDNDGVNHVNHYTVLSTPSGTVNEFYIDSLQNNYGDQYRGEIQVDLSNNIYIASSTRSSNFPVTPGCFDNTLGGKQDAIVAKFNPSLSSLLFCTYLGGSSNDCGNSIIVTSNFDSYITGGTCSQNFTTT
ncbi:MAG: repeat-containing protein, partial [Bacteroidetes bacterium]|nr:repeat-containing protein [Bacteroidota bacterium]